jgi:hypothetical protein
MATVQVGSATSWPSRLRTRGPMHRDLAAVEADLVLRRAPAVAAAAVRRAGELPRILTQHVFNNSDPSRQTNALK